MFFTSDTHFHHKNAIRNSGRPFADNEEMHEALIDRWNAVVRPSDEIWHLGDFSFVKDEMANRLIFERLNGRKRLIIGNHDSRDHMLKLGWDEVKHYHWLNYAKVKFCLFHYPIHEWDGFWHNFKDRQPSVVRSVHLFGHVHSTPTEPKHDFHPLSMDVGVDANDYRPVHIDDILARMKNKWETQ